MRKPTTILLMALALALALALIPVQQQTAVVVATPLHPLRRSRFLASVDNFLSPPPSFYDDCSKKGESFCKEQAPRSPNAKCCQRTCVDTDYSFLHCGKCGTPCEYAQTCCKRNCVNTFTDKNNCGGCGVKCRKKCTNGYCDYAA